MTDVPDSLELPAVLSIRELASKRSGAAQLSAFTAHAREIAAMSNVELLQEFDHQDDPLMLWVVHREADGRGLPPALRWGRFTRMPLVAAADEASGPSGDASDRQLVFINWLADMHWLTARDRGWRPTEPAWSAVGERIPNSADWHAAAMQVFVDGSRRPENFVARFGLSERSRLATLTLATPEVQADRTSLLHLEDLTLRLALYAAAHPDRSGVFTPAQVVERRLMAHRLFVLAGRRQGLGAQYQALVTGQTVSRQAFTRQLDALASSASSPQRMGSLVEPDRLNAV